MTSSLRRLPVGRSQRRSVGAARPATRRKPTSPTRRHPGSFPTPLASLLPAVASGWQRQRRRRRRSVAMFESDDSETTTDRPDGGGVRVAGEQACRPAWPVNPSRRPGPGGQRHSAVAAGALLAGGFSFPASSAETAASGRQLL